MINDTPDTIKDVIKLDNFPYKDPDTYIPVITKENYEIGRIIRYFVGKINYDSIVETDAKSYQLMSPNFFRKVQVNWKISGPEYNVVRGGMLESIGVVQYNFTQIYKAKKIIPNIETVLNNPRQFWRGY